MNHRIICRFEICNNYYIYIKPVCSWKSTEHLNSNFWKFVSSKPNIFIHLTYQHQVKTFLLPHKKIPKWGFHKGEIPHSYLKKYIWFLHENVYSSQKKLVIFQAHDPIIKYLRNTSLKTFTRTYSTIFYLNNASSFKGICGETGYFF